MQAKRVDEFDGAVGESIDRVARLTAGVADADVVEQDDVVIGRQVVEELGVLPVDGAAEPIEQDQGNTAARTDSPVCEPGGRAVHGKVFGGVRQKCGH